MVTGIGSDLSSVNNQDKVEGKSRSKALIKLRNKDLGLDVAETEKMFDGIIEDLKLDHQEKIDPIVKKRAALREIEESANTISQKLNFLRGISQAEQDIFAARTVSISNTLGKNIIAQNSSLVCVVGKRAPFRQIKMDIRQLASFDRSEAIDANFPKKLKEPMGLNGPLMVNDVMIEIEPKMTLSDIKEALVSVSKEGNFDVFIDTIKAEEPSADGTYRLQIQAKEEATPLTITADDQNNKILSTLNIKESGKTVDNLSAKIVVDGQEFVRGSNIISDAIEGFTFKLSDVTPSNKQDYLTLKVERDIVSTAQKVFELADAIAKFYELENKHCAVTKGKGELLAHDHTMNDVRAAMNSFFNSPILGAKDKDFKFVSDLGFSLKMQENYTYKFGFDREKFSENLQKDPEKIARFFTFSCESTNLSFSFFPSQQYQFNSVLKAVPIQLKVEKDAAGVLSAKFQKGSEGWVDASIEKNGIINGKEGTIYSSLVFMVSKSFIDNLMSGASVSTTLRFTQGKAEELAQNLSGQLGGEEASFDKGNMDKDIKKIEELEEKYKQDLEKKINEQIKEKKSVIAEINKATFSYNHNEKMLKNFRKFLFS